MRIWRYVTWRNEKCQSDCAGSGAGTDRDTKRLLIAVMPEQGVRSHVSPKPVWVSSVASDPNAAANAVTLRSDPPPSKLLSRRYYLYNQPCSANVNAAPTSGATHDTTLTGSGNNCSGTSKPDLMGEGLPVAGSCTAYPCDFSNEVATGPPGGLKMQNASGCTQDYTSASDKSKSHTWVTPTLPTLTRIKSSVTLTFYAVGAGATAANTHLCVSLARRQASGAECSTPSTCALGSDPTSAPCTQSPAPWNAGSPEPVEAFTCSFNLDFGKGHPDTPDDGSASDGSYYWDVPAGNRLALNVSVDSSAPIFLLYDHPSYKSNLRVSTCITPTVTSCS